jgi:DNA-binding MarR family transcriptional regulator
MQTQAFLNAYLTDVELAVWRGFFRVHSRLVRELDRELETKHGLPLTQFEVLTHLAKTPDGRMRMSELASTVLLSQSGVTRLVDRLERDGLVAREPCPDDRRGLHARITDEGRRRLTEALPTHFDDVRARFFAHLDDDDLRTLVGLWERVQPGVTGP